MIKAKPLVVGFCGDHRRVSRALVLSQMATMVAMADASEIMRKARLESPKGFDPRASLSNTVENELLLHVFQNSDIALIGDATGLRGSTTAGSLYVSLHTADPAEAGDQTSNEATYTSYARVAVARTAGGWTVAANQVSNAAAINFPACTGGTNTITYFGVGASSAGAGKLILSGPLGSALGPFLGENSSDVISIKGHGLVADDRISFFPIPNAALPAGITEGQLYFVKTTPDADSITIAATSGGATIDLTGDGDGVAFKNVPLAVSNGITPNFAIGALAYLLD